MKCLAFVVLLGACAGGPHARGDQRLTIQAGYGDPIKGDALGFDGNGTAKNAGAGAGFEHFLQDRLALAGIFSYRYYDQSDGPVHSAEITIGLRHFLLEVGDVAFSIDVFGGFMLASRSVPEAGSAYNFLGGIGPTVEVAVSERTSLFFSYQFRHLSNGRGGSAADNPTQNDHRVVVGFAIKW